ncbi:RAB11-binding protein RELCH isoform X7 [Rhinatrema bivittatum]|uniref:RAB11-binding protein RELCH isoform X7 n=1 Tax=Rhinatrema bivittatum TaxID=194408 RepID=UPI00112C1EC4|nr:RAB11-binding protein RELCH isoform X7 [Rhinatrema bivittatum]
MAAGGGVNPFLSDSEEEPEPQSQADSSGGAEEEDDEEEVAAVARPVQVLSPLQEAAAAPLPSPRAATAPGDGAAADFPRVPLDALAAQLLRDQYLLTALELHTELQECGRELPRLRDYFSNPGNFERLQGSGGTPPGAAPHVAGPGAALAGAYREPGAAAGPSGNLNRAGSISTLDSLDFARYSDDGNRETDERMAVLEFELRKAKETIQALRVNLTQAAENEVPLQERKNYKSSPEIQEPIKPLEKRALNFLVNEFLLKNNYKLTSITFSDENDDQDFELWDDVGLNIPKPPDLLQLYRDFGNHQIAAKDVVDIAVGVEEEELDAIPTKENVAAFEELQVTEQSAIVRKLEDHINLLNNEKLSLIEQIQKLESEIDALKKESLVTPVVYNVVPGSLDRVPCQHAEDNGHYLEIRRSDSDSNSRKSEEKKCSVATESEINSRLPVEESLHPVFRKQKEKMTASPLSKDAVQFDKPNRKLSPAFHQALLAFCRMSADSRLGSEVSRIADSEKGVMLMLGRCLPHIVPNVLLAKREINHKYPERRLLVAESCGALAPYLPKEIRSSLVLSMLQQMLMEDKADMVREAVIKSLGIIMGYIDDQDKYQQGFELLQTALGDPSERVVSATHQVFLPAYSAWTTELGNLQSHLIPTLLNKIEKLLREGDHGLDEHKLHMYLSALQSLIPSLFALVLQNAPFTSKAKLQGEVSQIEVTRFPRPVSPLQDVATLIGSREQLAVLLQLYDYQLEHEGTTSWESLLWVVNQLLPQLIEIVGRINVASTACVHEFSRFFWRLCRTFGKIFTNTKVKPQFQEILRLSEENIDSTAGNGVLTKATVPIYATGVLTCYNQEEDRKLLVGFLEDVMTMLSLSHAPLDSLKASFVELGANPAYHELLLTVLWYGVVHTSALVRCTAARMFELLVKGVNETLVAQRVVPALITLSSDPEISVRIATIPAFGTIMETVTQRELLERVKMQLASFLEDPQYQDQHSLHTEIIKTFGRVGPNTEPRFRDEFVLPNLHKLALVNNQQAVDAKRLDIATHLFEAYSALSCCFISEDLMVNHFLPGLRCLRTDMEHLSPEHEVILSSMIKECEQKLENKTVQEPQGSMSIAASLVSEDTKTKFLNKMGQLTTSGAMLANVFQRKK